MGPHDILRSRGETDSGENLKLKILCQIPFKRIALQGEQIMSGIAVTGQRHFKSFFYSVSLKTEFHQLLYHKIVRVNGVGFRHPPVQTTVVI